MKPLWGKLRNSYFFYKSQVWTTLADDSMGTGPFNFFRCNRVIFGGRSTLLKGNQMSMSLLTLSHRLAKCLAVGLVNLRGTKLHLFWIQLSSTP